MQSPITTTLPLSETADKDAKRPQAAALAPEVCASASASIITPPAKTPWMKIQPLLLYVNVPNILSRGNRRIDEQHHT